MDEQKNKVPEVVADDSLLAGTSFGKSREELKAEALAAKQEAKRKKQEERQLAKASGGIVRDEMLQDKSGLIFLLVLVVLVVLAVLLGLFWNVLFGDPQAEKDAAAKVQNEELSYFLDDQAQAELSAEGIKGAITKAYYTVGGYLAVQFDLGNGMATAQHPTSVYVELSNEDDTVLATGFTDAIDEEFVVEAGTHGSFFLYISPEFVKVTDDDLDQLSYTITVDSIAA